MAGAAGQTPARVGARAAALNTRADLLVELAERGYLSSHLSVREVARAVGIPAEDVRAALRRRHGRARRSR